MEDIFWVQFWLPYLRAREPREISWEPRSPRGTQDRRFYLLNIRMYQLTKTMNGRYLYDEYDNYSTKVSINVILPRKTVQ